MALFPQDLGLPSPEAGVMAVVQALESLYAARGDVLYGESVTQKEHAVQCAALARRAGAGSELVAAALLHDIGHLAGPDDWRAANRHDADGADLLGVYFSARVCEPVRQHAEAKRYLCATREGYFETLSAASRHSLTYQGGVMTPEECRAFEALPHFEAAIHLRLWDDTGKDTDLSGLAFADFRPELIAALQAR
ncbi:HD domain-containing protein [Telmatospirillum sp. J64-1]|uniref:HD domain-containing protein n=1 Tax=Telmatospirillum sp. J64-1 TaxID=2502183 RepID=UPI001C8F87AD|nr:HD domain-containing protein [Telmatospirillum sp. J64-1]